MALHKKDYGGYGNYDRVYDHLKANNPVVQNAYDNGVLASQFQKNQSQFIQNANTDPWATAGTLLGAIAATIKNNYDERGAQKASDGIFNSLGLGEPQQRPVYEQNNAGISMNNPTGEPQGPSVLDQISQGVTIGNQVEQGISQNNRNAIWANAMDKWGRDPNANQTALALQDATDGVNANFVLGTGPTRNQMINTALERGRKAGLNQYQLDALARRVGDAYDARYDSDMRQYNRDMTSQIGNALSNGDYRQVSGLLANMTAINPSLANSLGTIAKIRMDNDVQQQRINELINTGARKAGVEEELIGGYQSPYGQKDIDRILKLVENDPSGMDGLSFIPDGNGGYLTYRDALQFIRNDISKNNPGNTIPDTIAMGVAEVMNKLGSNGTISDDDLYSILSKKQDLMKNPRYKVGLTQQLRAQGVLQPNESVYDKFITLDKAAKTKTDKGQQLGKGANTTSLNQTLPAEVADGPEGMLYRKLEAEKAQRAKDEANRNAWSQRKL